MEKDYKIEINIAPDELTASLRLTPLNDEAGEIGTEALNTAIANAGVVHGIREALLKKIAQEHPVGEWIVIANGNLAEAGQDGDVQFLFSTARGDVHLKEKADGRVNIRDLNIIQNVNTGDVLCKLIPPTRGTDGMTVTGKPIPAEEGKSAVLPGGKNVEMAEDGSALIAADDGMVLWIENKVHVQPVYTVDRVDASVGNIRFNGSVAINGEVGDGYEIQAKRDISVAMSMGRVLLDAGQNVRITGGILGQQKGSIKAGGDVHLKFIQDASVEAGGNVIVEDYILNSEVTAGGAVVVKSPSGWIAGSTVSSESLIYAHTIGIESAPSDSTLIIGYNPRLSIEREELTDGIVGRVKDFLKLQASVAKLRKIKAKSGLNSEQDKLYTKVLAAVESIRVGLHENESRIGEIDSKIHSVFSGHVAVGGIINEGTFIHIGNAFREVSKPLVSTRFSRSEDGTLIEEAFTPDEQLKKILESD